MLLLLSLVQFSVILVMLSTLWCYSSYLEYILVLFLLTRVYLFQCYILAISNTVCCYSWYFEYTWCYSCYLEYTLVLFLSRVHFCVTLVILSTFWFYSYYLEYALQCYSSYLEYILVLFLLS